MENKNIFSLAEKEVTIENKVQILRTGIIDYCQDPFIVNSEILKKLKENFDNNARGIDLAIDYEHNNMGQSAGWIKSIDLDNNDTELWAFVDWNEEGKEKISKKIFRYLSSEFSMNFKNIETGMEYGPTLFGVALTNRPVVKNMQPVTKLSEASMENEEKKEEVIEVEAPIIEEEKKEEIIVNPIEEENKELKAKLEEVEKQLSEIKEEKKLSERKSNFNVLLSEGKACEAQRDSYLKMDMESFISLAQPIKLSEIGSPNKESIINNLSNEDKIIKFAEEKIKNGMEVKAAYSAVINEHPELV